MKNLQKQIDTYRGEIANYQAAINLYINTTEQLKISNSTEINALLAKLNAQDSIISEFHSKLSKRDVDFTKFTAEIAHLKHQETTLGFLNDKLTIDNDVLYNSVRKLSEQEVALRSLINRLQDENDEITNEQSAVRTAYEKAADECAQLKYQNAELEKYNTQLRKEKENLLSSLSTLGLEWDELDKDNDKLDRKCDDLKDECDKMADATLQHIINLGIILCELRRIMPTAQLQSILRQIDSPVPVVVAELKHNAIRLSKKTYWKPYAFLAAVISGAAIVIKYKFSAAL